MNRREKRMTKAAELTIERLPLADLEAHPRNPRTHPAPGSLEWETLRKSLEHDYFDPLVWNRRNGMLVSGHLRKKILEADGYTHADCVVVDYDEPTHLARMLAANRATGKNDLAALASLMDEFRQADAFAELSNWPEDAIRDILPSMDPIKLQKVPLNLPTMTWVLFGIPTVRFAEVAARIDELAAVPETFLEMMANDASPQS